jgi:hypothetical protein
MADGTTVLKAANAVKTRLAVALSRELRLRRQTGFSVPGA